ncbi:ComEA family DNA-binding protein [Formosa haliotis]|uniref:ComEA family DNA-binding protein n=1 Tax=Formosa haliotis TaxID=1555194 RepID=UPI000826D248|nr:helix-hairpin-helix domain-containing protein [Formosa haliotis]
MKTFKSHIMFSKQQRYGIFLLLFIIVVLQCVYFFWTPNPEDIQVDNAELEHFQKEMDALKALEKEKAKPKLFPFNPNYITDFKGYSLGMSNEEIDKLHAFREEDKWINSAEDFQKVTGISDSLLQELSPYFKFPDWVSSQTNKTESTSVKPKKPLSFEAKSDLNTASQAQLQQIYGVGEKLSQRIITYRNKFEGGFIDDVQLYGIYGLSPEVIEQLKAKFTVKTPRVVQKLDLNTAEVSDLVKIEYIDYPLAHKIIEYRTLHEGFTNLEELLKVKSFPIQKFDIIKLYLALN